jgi:DNA-binding response OmpR family regulator
VTILFAERRVLPRNIIRIFLQENYEVLVAADGHEALELSQAYLGTIDVLLSDVGIAGRGGLPLHRVIVDHRPGIRILPIATHPDESLSVTHSEPFLTKPFQLGELYGALEELLEQTAGQGENPASHSDC